MNKLIIEIIGWYGVLAILIAYLFIGFGIIGAESATYQILNFSGAIGIIAISLLKKTYQPAALNFIWSLIAFIALLKIIF